MAQVSRTTAKNYFVTAAVPTQSNFTDLIDSARWYNDFMQVFQRIGTDQAIAGATLTNVTGATGSVTAGKKYAIIFSGKATTSLATSGHTFSLSHPGGDYTNSISQTSSSSTGLFFNEINAQVSTTSSLVAGSGFLNIYFYDCSTSGTINIQVANEASDTTTIKAGTFFILLQLN